MADNNLGNKYQSYAQAVIAAQQGEQDAFRFLYESTYRDKYFIAQKYMKNETDAQDVLQDAYIKAWQNLERLQEPDKFSNWFSLIVANTALDTLKKKKDLPFSAMVQASEDGDTFSYEEEDWRKEYQPEHAYTDQETSELLKELLDSLSDEQRFCMLMYYVEEHSVGEIAQLIGCSEGTVKSRLNYGRKNLKAKAEDLEKKGYTLYSIAPVPLLLLLLRKQAQTTPISIPALDMTVKTVATTAGKTTGAASASLAVKVAAAVLAVAVLGGGGYAISRILRSPEETQTASADDSNSDDNAFLTAFTDSTSEPEDRHSYLLACIEAAGDYYHAEWDELLFDDWNGDNQEDVVFRGSCASDKIGYVACIAGTSQNTFDELFKHNASDTLEEVSFFKLPTDDGMHLAFCYTGTILYNGRNLPVVHGRIISFEEEKPHTEVSGSCTFNNPQHNSIGAHYVNFDRDGGVKSDADTSIVWSGKRYTGTYYIYYTADAWYGSGLLFREDEGPNARK